MAYNTERLQQQLASLLGFGDVPEAFSGPAKDIFSLLSYPYIIAGTNIRAGGRRPPGGIKRSPKRAPKDPAEWEVPELPELPANAKPVGRQAHHRAAGVREQALAEQQKLGEVPPGGLAYEQYVQRFRENHDLLNRLINELNRWYPQGK
jgi:hypothetical protein